MPLVTPDGRYIVVRGRLWRRSDPRLPEQRRQELVDELIDARRAVGRAMRSGRTVLDSARAAVDAAKTALGERRPVGGTTARRISTDASRARRRMPTGMPLRANAGEDQETLT